MTLPGLLSSFVTGFSSTPRRGPRSPALFFRFVVTLSFAPLSTPLSVRTCPDPRPAPLLHSSTSSGLLPHPPVVHLFSCFLLSSRPRLRSQGPRTTHGNPFMKRERPDGGVDLLHSNLIYYNSLGVWTPWIPRFGGSLSPS